MTSFREHYVRVEDPVHVCRISLDLAVKVPDTGTSEFFATDHTLWNTEEDRIVVYCEDMKEIDWGKVYRMHRREQPDVFPKVNVDSATMKNRITELRMNIERLKLIRASSQDLLGATIGSNNARSAAFDETIGSSLYFPKAAGVPTSPSGGGPPSISSPKSANAGARSGIRQENSVPIRCICRTVKNSGEVYIDLDVMQRSSPVLSEMYRLSHRLVLSESDPLYRDQENMFDVFSVDNVEAFVRFVAHPEPWEERKAAEAQLAALKAQESEKWDNFFASYRSNHKKHVDDLKVKFDADMASLNEDLDKAYRKDLATLTRLYEVHKGREGARLRQRYEHTVHAVDTYFHQEADRLRSILSRIEMHDITACEARVKDLQRTCESLLPEENLLRLLMLADALQCMKLRDVCLTAATSGLLQLHNSEKWTSPVLQHSTVRHMLTLPSDAVINTLYKAESTALPRNLLEEEYNHRREAYVDFCRSRTTSQLHTIHDRGPKDVAWLDLVANELQLRDLRESTKDDLSLVFPTSESARVTPDGVVTPAHPLVDIVVAVARGRRLEGAWGRWYWEVEIQKLEEGFGGTIGVGLETMPQRGGDFPRVLYTSDGVVRAGKDVIEASQTFGEGDVISVLLDLHELSVGFVKNGAAELVRLRPLGHHVPLAELCKGMDLHPCVYMFQPLAGVRMRAAVTLFPPFKHAMPAHHRAYGDKHPQSYADEAKAATGSRASPRMEQSL